MDPEEVGAYWTRNAEAWTALSRAGFDVNRDHLNTPVFLDSLPAIDGLSGLDIGCGEGSNTRKLAAMGAKMTAIDIAAPFVAAAREVEGRDPHGITYRQGDGTALDFEAESFDFATSFMALMDMPRQDVALAEAARVIRPGGFFKFSILHPCFAPPTRRMIRDREGRALCVVLADYFSDDHGTVETWTFADLPPELAAKHPLFDVPRFHTPLGTWVAMIRAAGLTIEAMEEPMADPDLAARVPAIADSRIAPNFLHVLTRKPVGQQG